MSPLESFTLYARKTKNGKKVWYYRTYEDGKRTSGRSTGETNKQAAQSYVLSLIKKGALHVRTNPTFEESSQDWWEWEKCKYLKRQLAKGKSVSRDYADTMRSYLKNHLLPYFGSMHLQSIKTATVDDWLIELREKPGKDGGKLSAVTANNVLRCLKIMLADAKRRDLIFQDPTEGFGRIEVSPAKKGILTLPEIRELFLEDNINQVWERDPLHYTLNILSCATGMRMGEIQALQVGRVQPDYVQILQSWSRRYGLKPPKRNSMREIPVPGKVAQHLHELIDRFSDRDLKGFVFSLDGKTPVSNGAISDHFYRALNAIGISEEMRRERRISFHSHRYFFNSALRNRVHDSKVRVLTGHRTESMTDHYTVLSRHDLEDVRKITEGFFTE